MNFCWLQSKPKHLAKSRVFCSQGFSLIEVLVAMAIMAVISVGALTILNKATQAKSNIKSNGDRLNNVQRAFLFLSNDIQQITKRPIRDEYGDKQPSMKTELEASEPYFQLTRLGRRNPAKLARSNLEHLRYSVVDNVLVRTSFSFTDGMSEDFALKRPILDGVEEMSVNFYDGEQWHESWPLLVSDPEAPVQVLPVAIKFKLKLSDYGELERLFAISDRVTPNE
ncbi:type II secretion system minor pseudopilin GspJ [Aliikangiella sp. IMCC44653]